MEMTVPNILSLAKFCEYITASRIGAHNALQGGDINETWARTIYMERTAVQNRYNLNPSDPTLQGAANYLFSILRYISEATTRKNNLAGALPILTGPTSQSVTVGSTATFSVSVVSSTNVTYQWLLNNVPIPGATNATYLVTNAQLSQSGGLYSVQVTNSTGPVTSNQVTLTVTAAYGGFYYQGTTDYSTDLMGGNDDVPYLGSFSIAAGNPFTVTFPNLVATQYIVVKYPAAETTKTSFLNPPPSGPDGGPIPNISLNETTIGAWKYIFSRTGNTFGLNNVNGQVKFS